MRIVFRADASSQIGTGHIMRCLALADRLSAKGCEIHFLCDGLPPFLAQLLDDKGYFLHSLERDGKPVLNADIAWDIISTLGKVDWLIIDHYSIDSVWEASIKPLVGQVMVIDDLANRQHQCHVLLDQNFYLDAGSRYTGLVPDDTRLLLGPSYALLRPDFPEARRIKAASKPKEAVAQRILICFGGADPTNESMKTLRALAPLMFEMDCTVEVIVGAACTHLEEIHAFVGENQWANLTINARDIAKRMVSADLAIGAAGSMSWERASIGLPSIAIAVAKNQVLLAEHAASRGIHLYLGWHDEVTEDGLREAASLLLGNRFLRAAFTNASMSLCDGQGVDRVAKILLGALVSVRKATLNDALKVFNWRNAAENRRHSHDGREIAWESHQTWFEKAINDPDRIILIGSDASGDLGVVRYDRKNGDWLVSIYLAPDRHGGGFGEPLLRAGSAWLRENCSGAHKVRAEILMENRASQNVFLRAGYKPAFITYLETL